MHAVFGIAVSKASLEVALLVMDFSIPSHVLDKPVAHLADKLTKLAEQSFYISRKPLQ
ncbi:hypothetical protein [Streptococcus thoraltensis]|uniref:hypothetical protein n=1 Tax=Streptococcus thoraltensis TaxID=55085 RepID=UPI00037E7104|nr:hypothetical protein [Streptococcus thoraltensis]MDY4761234.1 hypothetical protein [Streptococcus thoraltensis]